MADVDIKDRFVISSDKTHILQNAKRIISIMFNVKIEIVEDEESENSQWVSASGDIKCVDRAREYVKALCNPDKIEKYSFPGLTVEIFEVFNGIIKFHVEYSTCTVITIDDEDKITIQGSLIGVTMALSKIHQLKKLQENTEIDTDESVKKFDKLIESNESDYSENLRKLSGSLKEELYDMIHESNEMFTEKIMELGTTILGDMSVFDTSKVMEAIEVSPPTNEMMEQSVIMISSDSESEEDIVVVGEFSASKEKKKQESSSISSASTSKTTNMDPPPPPDSVKLPDDDVIKQWLLANYEISGYNLDFVNKSELFTHFMQHFFGNMKKDQHGKIKNGFFNFLLTNLLNDPKHKIRQVGKKKKALLYGIKLKNTGINVSQKRTYEQRGSPINPNLRENRTKYQERPEFRPPPIPLSAFDPQAIRPHNIPPRNAPFGPKFQQNMLPPGIRPPRITPHGNYRPQNDTDYRPMPPPMNPTHHEGDKINIHDEVRAKVEKMTNKELMDFPNRRSSQNGLRPIVIDGSNVAMMHSGNKFFSCRGIALCIRYFFELGHKEITCFVPNHRQGGRPPEVTDAHMLQSLNECGFVKFTPSRRLPGNGSRIVCYDDRFILDLALSNDGVVVSNDQYRDLVDEKSGWRHVIQNRLLQPTFVGDLFMIPHDPLGKHGPSITEFLRLPGYHHNNNNKPRPNHPNGFDNHHNPESFAVVRPNVREQPRNIPPQVRPYLFVSPPLPPHKKILHEKLLELFPTQSKLITDVIERHPKIDDMDSMTKLVFQSITGEIDEPQVQSTSYQPKPRKRENALPPRRQEIYNDLLNIFPNEGETIKTVLLKHPSLNDMNVLCFKILQSTTGDYK